MEELCLSICSRRWEQNAQAESASFRQAVFRDNIDAQELVVGIPDADIPSRPQHGAVLLGPCDHRVLHGGRFATNDQSLREV